MRWLDLFEEWQHQEIFSQDPNEAALSFMRLEKYRKEIAWAFDVLSLGRMKTFECLPGQNIHWICGEKDLKFRKVAEKLAEKNPVKLTIYRGAAHRIHKFDPPGLRAILT